MRTKREIETEFAPREQLSQYKSFVLVGIGGAGMSGVARMLANRGYRVKGTDSTPSPVIEGLVVDGIQVAIGHSGNLLAAGDALVLTDAIDLDASPEVAKARELGCPLFRRSQVLGWLLRDKKTIAVTGTHGKTTTTGMIGAGLRAAGFDPTIVVGADVPEFGGAVCEGKGEYAVIEACEAYDSLRDFDPYIALLTNLELDHVDFHGSWESLKASMANFVDRVPKDGAFVWCEADEGAREFHERDWAGQCASVGYGTGGAQPAAMELPGKHNSLNAQGAFAVCKQVGADPEAASRGISGFHGAERRLQLMFAGEVTVVDDYAHHPTEIVASLQAVRERYVRDSGRLVVVYQPHLYSRTQPLIREFAQALDAADFVVLTDIYPAREDPIPGVSSFRISEHLTKPCLYVPQRHALPKAVLKVVRPGDVVVGMGAGNISEFAPGFSRLLSTPKNAAKRVAVVYGGDSAEREVSILSGREVCAALTRKGHKAWLVDVSEGLLGKGNVDGLVGPNSPDVCFLAVHGTHAEDGAIQGLLELLHLAYTGSGILSSAMALDKELTKQVLAREGLPVPAGFTVRSVAELESKAGAQASALVVKPNAQGSTVGLSFVEPGGDLRAAVARALQFDDSALVEEWLRGIEISVPVLGDRALPVVEIVPQQGGYDFANKYTPGATNEIVPARLTEEQTRMAQEQAVRAHRALGCKGCTRTDMIVLEDRIVCLEVNTLPGMTSTSLVPNSARAAGIDFDELCDWMVQDAAPA